MSKLSFALFIILAGQLPVSPVWAASNGSQEDAGLKLEWQYQASPVQDPETSLGLLDIKLSDSLSGRSQNYEAKQLAAWIIPKTTNQQDEKLSCPDKVRQLSSLGLGQRAEIDLNGWRLVTMNSDRSLAFINPFVGLNNAKLESIVPLPGDIDDWLTVPQHLKLWVHVHTANDSQLLSIDTHRRQISQRINTPAGSGKIILDHHYLWIVSPAAQTLSAVDTYQTDSNIKSISTPEIAGAIAAEQGGLYSWPNNATLLQYWQSNANGQPKLVRQWSLPQQALSSAWSQHAKRLIISLAGGRFAWIDPAKPSQNVERTVALSSKDIHISDFQLFDAGRRLLWLDAQAAKAGVIDIASGRELITIPVAASADNIAFSEHYAYIHSTAQARATLLSLANIGSGKAETIEITTGQPSPEPATGKRIIADPGQQGLLVANPSDGVIYQYAEGMMAPMGSFSNYRRSALGLIILDKGLAEISPGHYRVPIRHQQGGLHELIVSGLNPKFHVCSTLNLPEPQNPAQPLKESTITASLESLEAVGNPLDLTRLVRVHLQQRLTKQSINPAKLKQQNFSGVQDLTLLVFDRRNAWQQRLTLTEAETGIYSATVKLPRSGPFDWHVASNALNLDFNAGKLGRYEVKQP